MLDAFALRICHIVSATLAGACLFVRLQFCLLVCECVCCFWKQGWPVMGFGGRAGCLDLELMFAVRAQGPSFSVRRLTVLGFPVQADVFWGSHQGLTVCLAVSGISVHMLCIG